MSCQPLLVFVLLFSIFTFGSTFIVLFYSAKLGQCLTQKCSLSSVGNETNDTLTNNDNDDYLSYSQCIAFEVLFALTVFTNIVCVLSALAIWTRTDHDQWRKDENQFANLFGLSLLGGAFLALVIFMVILLVYPLGNFTYYMYKTCMKCFRKENNTNEQIPYNSLPSLDVD